MSGLRIVNTENRIRILIEEASLSSGECCITLNDDLIPNLERSIPVFANQNQNEPSLTSTNIIIDNADRLILNSTENAIDTNTGSIRTLGGLAVKKNIRTDSNIYCSELQTFSDQRLKEDIDNIKVVDGEIQFKQYSLKNEEGKNKKIKYGVIAQDVYEVFPDLVDVDNNGFMSIDYRSLYSYMINDLSSKLKQEIQKTKSLEEQIAKIEKDLNIIKRNF